MQMTPRPAWGLAVRDFERVADFLIPHRRIVHIVVLVISLLMVPGMILALSPIDMESYNMESPELDAREVILKEYPANEVTSGYAVIIRDQSKVGTEPHWVYADEFAEYGGDGVGDPIEDGTPGTRAIDK